MARHVTPGGSINGGWPIFTHGAHYDRIAGLSQSVPAVASRRHRRRRAVASERAACDRTTDSEQSSHEADLERQREMYLFHLKRGLVCCWVVSSLEIQIVCAGRETRGLQIKNVSTRIAQG